VTEPISVDTRRLRLIGRELSDQSREVLLPAWDGLSRAGLPADPNAAGAEGSDVAAGLTACVAAVGEELRRTMVRLQEIGDSLVHSAQDYEQTDRESKRLTREVVDDRADVPVPHTDPSRWKL
jgi:Excreted virulence factor EspC, type VII ESX diderm